MGQVEKVEPQVTFSDAQLYGVLFILASFLNIPKESSFAFFFPLGIFRQAFPLGFLTPTSWGPFEL